jgi:hypothetical protein
MQEGEEHGLQGEVVPGRVEAARPHDHAALAHGLRRQGHRAVVEAGDDAVLRVQLPIAEEARGGEVAAVGTAEEVEHGMAVVDIGEGGAPVRRAVDGGAERPREKGRRLRGPGRGVL